MGELKLIVQPDAEEAESAEIYVDGRVDGKLYRFLLDTGAARSRVVYDDYTATLPSTTKSSSSGVFAAITEDLITISKLEVGPISRQNLTITRGAASDIRRVSLIGMDVLKDYYCHFRFDEARVEVNDRSTGEVSFSFQPFYVDKVYHPYVDVQLSTVLAKAVWDTGASLTVADLNFIQRYPQFFTHDGQSTGTDAGGAQTETPMFVMSEVVLGSHTFSPHRVAGVDLSRVNATLEIPMDLILGYSTLSQANWVFDFPGKRWAIA